MSQNNLEDVSMKEVFDSLSSYFHDTYEGLRNVLHEEPNYKRLLKIGEKQFFDAPNESSIEKESQNSKLYILTSSWLAMEVDNDIDRIIKEKFQGKFLDDLKEEILKAILQLSTGQVNSFEAVSQASTSQIKSMTNEEKTIFSRIKNSCNGNGHNFFHIEEDSIDGEAGPSLATLFNGDNSVSEFLSGSVSSVHTSDLSSFEDEIVLSDDEGFGTRRRLSLKEVQEKLEKSAPEEDMEITENDKEDVTIKEEDVQHDSSVNDSDASSPSQKSQRRRKPNLKYIEDNLESPFRKKSTVGKVPSSSKSVCGDVPRKRGRPRKHST